MKKILDNFKSELRKDIDVDMKSNLQASLNPVREEIKSPNSRIGMLDKQMKKNNLILYGLKEDENENYEMADNLVMNLLNHDLKLGISVNSINYVRWLGRVSENSRPMLVKFNNFRVKL